jgi:hypothetical protein
MKKLTRATLKSFVKKNIDDLFINVKSSFNGMIDGCQEEKGGFEKIELTNKDFHFDNTLGIKDVWLVGGNGSSKDHFTHHDDRQFSGIKVNNCCGIFVLAIKKEEAPCTLN